MTGTPRDASRTDLNRAVLIVGGEIAVREALRGAAADAECRVDCVSTVEAARAKLASEAYVAVVMEPALVSESARARENLEGAYRREHHIADVLQRAMVPAVTLEIPGYGLAARYQPALEEAEVGGDFYDVFRLRDGRIALVVADVSGKGLQAAVHTAAAKYMLRAYALENSDPAYVLEHLNRAMYDYLREDVFITVFYGVLDTRKQYLIYANAGHDQPLFYHHQTRWAPSLDVTGRAVSISRDSTYGRGTLQFTPGDVLLIYTDGITEARSHGRFFGIKGLTEVFVSSACDDEQEIVDTVFEAASRAGEGHLRDDAAVVALKSRFDSN